MDSENNYRRNASRYLGQQSVDRAVTARAAIAEAELAIAEGLPTKWDCANVRIGDPLRKYLRRKGDKSKTRKSR